jgi:hypothetical protein
MNVELLLYEINIGPADIHHFLFPAPGRKEELPTRRSSGPLAPRRDVNCAFAYAFVLWGLGIGPFVGARVLHADMAVLTLGVPGINFIR